MPWTAAWLLLAVAGQVACAGPAARPRPVVKRPPPPPPVPRQWEGFFAIPTVSRTWLRNRGIPLQTSVLRSVLPRTAKLIIAGGKRQAPRPALDAMRNQYCKAPAVRAWNEDRCRALKARRCKGGSCSYQHYGNCSGFLLGGGVLLTAAHCVAKLATDPTLARSSAVLLPGPHGKPGKRLPLGEISLGKEDFAFHWVVLPQGRDPVDAAAVVIEDGGMPRWPVARPPQRGGVVFIVGYPRVEGRSAADRRRHRYSLVAGTLAASFGRIADRNPGDHPLCSVDGKQEHWALATPCPTAEVQLPDGTGWRGVILRSPFLSTHDSINGYSGAPLFDVLGRLVGINSTIIGPHNPQQRYGDLAVATPVIRVLKRLSLLSVPAAPPTRKEQNK